MTTYVSIQFRDLIIRSNKIRTISLRLETEKGIHPQLLHLNEFKRGDNIVLKRTYHSFAYSRSVYWNGQFWQYLDGSTPEQAA